MDANALPDKVTVEGGRFIQWRNNVPVPRYKDPITLNFEQAKEAQVNALLLPYTGFPDEETGELTIEPRFKGLTNFQVMYIRRAEAAALGDLKAIAQIEDRLFGKPKQSVESVSMSMTYQQFLETLHEQDAGDFTIDATAPEDANNDGVIDIDFSDVDDL